MNIQRRRPGRFTRLSAVVRYELLWNIRKKKLYGVIILAFALATLQLALPLLLGIITGSTLQANPDFAVGTGMGIGGLGFFLFALVVAMNSVSAEFESGTIVPLLTKPVSRTSIFLGKVIAAFITLLGSYVILTIYLAVGSFFVYGPQSNLELMPIVLLGNMLSTSVWVSIILALSTLSKNSMVSAIAGAGIWLGLTIVAQIFGLFSTQSWVLSYLPGPGSSGYDLNLPSSSSFLGSLGLPNGLSVSTGTDGVGANLATLILHPNAQISFFNIQLSPSPIIVPLYSQTLSFILLRSVFVAACYIMAFSLIAWFFFRRAEVTE